MEADFSGYVTKAGLKCSDGRTILPDAFKHQDKTQVPLVWMHGHTDPENVLGHVILENREDGMYGYAFFNKSKKAEHMHHAVDHKDIKSMSIYAGELIERTKRVMHGAIREVSLVLVGANPGALIDNVNLRHGDGSFETIEDEAIITTDLDLEFGHSMPDDVAEVEKEEEENSDEDSSEDDSSDENSDDDENSSDENSDENSDDDDDSSDDNADENVDDNADATVEHADKSGDSGSKDDDGGETIGEIFDTLNDKQKDVVHYMIGEAIAATKADTVQHDDNSDQEGSAIMHNVFDTTGKPQKERKVLAHADLEGIMEDAGRLGSLKDAVQGYAIKHGIEDIDVLFPDAQSITGTPEFLARRTEWVNQFLGACKKSPFARVKTVWADITEDQARARGYITGNIKREEFFAVNKRVTTPTTIYKKQKLDRDDMVDITDFDVVAWLKAEMRVMLDEELARAILIGDGRDISHQDKINEQSIRPIAKDHELYTTTVNINIDDANSSIQEFIDAVVMNRSKWKGTGTPTLYTTELYIGKLLLLKDGQQRRMYKNLEEVASELRVGSIVPVEAMEEDPSVVAIIVNPQDYVIGADRGGALAMFDDFDIDYNQYKYLIETRVSGALTRLKSAMVFKKVASTSVLVSPNAPTFNPATGVMSIVTQTGVVYKKEDGTVLTAANSPYAALAPGAELTVYATPAAGYHFASSDDDTFVLRRNDA